MTKNQKKSATPRFTLPGDEVRVRVLAYVQGIWCVPTMVIMAEKEGELLSAPASIGDGYLVKVPKEEDIPHMAREIADIFVSGHPGDKQLTTNEPALFRECFIEPYLEGYRFGLFSIHRGLLDLLAKLPDDRHSELFYRFAVEKMTQGKDTYSDEAPDILMDNSVGAVEAIYKQYQTLN